MMISAKLMIIEFNNYTQNGNNYEQRNWESLNHGDEGEQLGQSLTASLERNQA